MKDGHSAVLMDFPDNDIYIIAESQWEQVFRANACVKEPITVRWIKEFAHKGIFYDVGANVGSYSLIAASLMKGDNVVVAFEPVFFNFYRLNQNIIINKFNDRIIPLNMGLTNKSAVETIYLKNLDFGVTNRALGNVKTELFTRTLCLTLDDIVNTGTIPFPQHIKIDVDGDEHAVLEGGKETFSDCRVQTVMIEIDESNNEEASQLYGFLSNAGFKLYEKNQLMSKNLSNALFIRG